MRKLLYLLLIVVLGVSIWFAFALWSGIYSIYSYPPSKDHPDGTMLVVTREEGEPMFNSPDYQPPKREARPSGTFGFEKVIGSRRPLESRTIVTLPYIEWAYKKSLEPQTAE